MSALPSPDLVREQAFLISRGLRPMALLGHCAPEQEADVRGLLYVHGANYEAIPFFHRTPTGFDFGFAAEGWVLELYVWAQGAPRPHRERIEGLLLGYSPAAIARHDAKERGRAAVGEDAG